MAAISKSCQFVFVLIACFITRSNSTKLNVPRVLLPYFIDLPTNYTLEISGGGCYKWSSSRPEIATVTPIDVFPDKDCSTKALVSAVSRLRTRHSTIVLAEDSANEHLLRCDVIVDSINSIEIITTTRELFLEDAPEEFVATAKNDQEDTFSSLDGVPFEWTLETTPDKTGVSGPGIRFLKFSESSYETPAYIDRLEKQQLQGDKVLVEGLRTGSSIVRVRLRNPAYMEVPKSEVNLIVLTNLVLNPAHDVYLLRNSAIHYRVEHIKQGRAYEVQMPSNEYYLELRDKTVATLNEEKSEVTALALGHTEIVLKDHSSDILGRDHLPRQPTAGVYVVEPSYMTFHVTPGVNWALQEFTEYEISVKLFDDRHHRIQPTDNLRVKVHFPSKHFNTNFASENGTYYQVKTLLPGPTKITGDLQGLLGTNGKIIPIGAASIKQTQEIIIYQALQVEPLVVLMPWDPLRKPSYSLAIKARGATGYYHWTTSNNSFVSVSYKPDLASRLANLKTVGLGSAVIAVKDAHNSIFKSSAQVSVQPVADLEILPTVVEAEIGQEIVIPLALYGFEDKDKTKRKIFDDCSEVPITVDIVDKTKIEYIPDAKFPAMGSGCRSLAFSCKAVGYSRIHVQYSSDELQLKTTAVLACHKPLKPVFPSRLLLLPIGSLAEVAFEGGPRAWPLSPEGHFTNMTIQDTSLARRTLMKDPHRFNKDLHVFRILCKELGETTLHVSIGNEKSATNQNPAVLTSSVQLACGIPESLFLKPVVKGPTGKKLPCPTGEEPVTIPVHNYRKLEIDVWAKDGKGRKFANITSFDIIWELSDYTLGKPEDARDVKTDMNTANGYLKLTRSYQVFIPVGKIGQLKVTASILGYRSDVLRKEELSGQERFSTPISRTISLNLVEDVSIDPVSVTVFNHATNKVFLNVTHGSGYFYVESSDETKAAVEYLENRRQIVVAPLENGFQSITIHDLCLETQDLAVAQVQVSGVEAIQVKMVDKVELNKSITAVVQVLGHQLQPIPVSLFPLMDLQATPISPLITTRFQGIAEGSETQALFKVTGVGLGHSSLIFHMGSSSNVTSAGEGLHVGYRGRPISSNPVPVQVFSPLRINPSNITLVVGAVFQVTCWGGPQPQASIEFLLQDQDIATVSGSGILTASRLGHTTLLARAVDTHPETGQTILYSQDQVSVFVVPLHGIQIHSPLHRIQTHATLPLYAMGLNEHENPFSFGSAVPPLLYKWTVSNPEVLKLQNFYKQPVSLAAEDQSFGVQVVALRSGQATVTLQVELSESAPEEIKLQIKSTGSHFKDEIQLQVFDTLELVRPSHISAGNILVTPNTRLQLKTNRDSYAKVQYLVKSESSNIVALEGTGLLVSKSQHGDGLLTIVAQEEFGLKQASALLVKVRPLSYLMVSSESPLRSRERALAALPVAMSTVLRVTSHDSIGRHFHATNTHIKFRPSRFDVVQISEGLENGTLVLTASKPGQVVLKVWDASNPHIADYVPIRVSLAIAPSSSTFTVGDVICFSCPLMSAEDQSGWWQSDSPMLSIHPSSGMAVAMDAGTALVHYNISSTQITSTQVLIAPVLSLTLDTSMLPQVTNVKNSQHNVYVYLGDESQKRKSNQHGSNCSASLPEIHPPFTCTLAFGGPSGEIAARQYFEVTPGFDLSTGRYMCSILAVDWEPSGQAHQTEMLPSPLHLHVHLGSLHQSVPLTFYAAFHVHVQEIFLSNVQPSATLGITAFGKVAELLMISTSDSNILEVLPAESDARMPHTLLFPVRLRDLSSLWHIDTLTSSLHLTASCALTKQSVLVQVKLKLLGSGGGSAGTSTCTIPAMPSQKSLFFDSSFLTSIAIILVTVLVIFLVSKVLGSRNASLSSTAGVVLTRNSPGYPYIPYRQQDSPDPSRPFLWSIDQSVSPSSRIHTPHTPPNNRSPRSPYLT